MSVETDPEMQKLMNAADAKEYKTKSAVMSYRRPKGEEKSYEMGMVSKGVIFTPVDSRAGYLAMTPNIWVFAAACELVGVEPIPDPTTESPFISATLTRADGSTEEFDLVSKG